ncbi:hypothetical protein ASD40_01710 [Paenibacillus sp. Root444D2]|nr:hypothetical protein ASD40_01710 [Paenibacillus sp. Root444D2]
MVLFTVFLIIFVFCVLALIAQRKMYKKLKQRAKELGADAQMFCHHVEGLPVTENALVSLFSLNDRLHIEFSGNKFELYSDKIITVKALTETEILEVSKSTIGRAVVGGILLGGLGAIVGGISGVGTKKKKGKTNNYLVINYHNKDSVPSVISFKNNMNYFALQKFANTVNKQIIQLNNVNGTVVL